jgi:hypothetical protein
MYVCMFPVRTFGLDVGELALNMCYILYFLKSNKSRTARVRRGLDSSDIVLLLRL